MRKAIMRAGLNLGPRGCVLLLAGCLWIVEAIGVHCHLDGWVKDAPHIRYGPTWLRASGWLITGLLAVLTARNRDKGKIGAASLLFMPIMRCFSYALAWIASWPGIDPLIPDSYLPGDPNAWYYLARNGAYLLLAVCACFAPIIWPLSDREVTNDRTVAR